MPSGTPPASAGSVLPARLVSAAPRTARRPAVAGCLSCDRSAPAAASPKSKHLVCIALVLYVEPSVRRLCRGARSASSSWTSTSETSCEIGSPLFKPEYSMNQCVSGCATAYYQLTCKFHMPGISTGRMPGSNVQRPTSVMSRNCGLWNCVSVRSLFIRPRRRCLCYAVPAGAPCLHVSGNSRHQPERLRIFKCPSCGGAWPDARACQGTPCIPAWPGTL